MDYKELIDEIRASNVDGDACIEKWADAIKTLLVEREAALGDLHHGGCEVCKYIDLDPTEEPCAHCYQAGGTGDYWQWRGPQKEE